MFRVTAHSHVDCSLFVCCGLRSIDISGCVKFDNSRLTWLSQSCLKLEDINISNCPNLSTLGVTQLIKRCPNLVIITALNVGRIEDAVGHAISSYIPNVVSLDASPFVSLFLYVCVCVCVSLCLCLSMSVSLYASLCLSLSLSPPLYPFRKTSRNEYHVTREEESVLPSVVALGFTGVSPCSSRVPPESYTVVSSDPLTAH